MMRISDRSPLSLGAAAALMMVSIFASQPTEAMSPINPASASTSKTVANGLMVEVRGGHGGGGVGGGGRSGGWGGGRSAGGVSGAFVRGGAIGAAPAAGAPRFAGHRFGHRRHFGGVSAASITTIIRMTIPTPTMIPPSIPLPPLSLEVAAAGC